MVVDDVAVVFVDVVVVVIAVVVLVDVDVDVTTVGVVSIGMKYVESTTRNCWATVTIWKF